MSALCEVQPPKEQRACMAVIVPRRGGQQEAANEGDDLVEQQGCQGVQGRVALLRGGQRPGLPVGGALARLLLVQPHAQHRCCEACAPKQETARVAGSGPAPRPAPLLRGLRTKTGNGSSCWQRSSPTPSTAAARPARPHAGAAQHVGQLAGNAVRVRESCMWMRQDAWSHIWQEQPWSQSINQIAADKQLQAKTAALHRKGCFSDDIQCRSAITIGRSLVCWDSRLKEHHREGLSHKASRAHERGSTSPAGAQSQGRTGGGLPPRTGPPCPRTPRQSRA